MSDRDLAQNLVGENSEGRDPAAASFFQAPRAQLLFDARVDSTVAFRRWCEGSLFAFPFRGLPRFLHREIDRCTFFEGLSFARQADLAIRDRLAVLLERCVRQTHKTGTRHPAEHFLERVAAQLVAWEQLGEQATGGSRAAGFKLTDDKEYRRSIIIYRRTE